MMMKLTTLILSAAIVPAFAPSTAAMAEVSDDMQADTEQGTGEQKSDKQRVGKQQMSQDISAIVSEAPS